MDETQVLDRILAPSGQSVRQLCDQVVLYLTQSFHINQVLQKDPHQLDELFKVLKSSPYAENIAFLESGVLSVPPKGMPKSQEERWSILEASRLSLEKEVVSYEE